MLVAEPWVLNAVCAAPRQGPKLLEGSMVRVDGYYLYYLGATLAMLRALKKDTKASDAALRLYMAEARLDEFLHRSVFRLKTAYPKGAELLKAIRKTREDAETSLQGSPTEDKEIGWAAYTVTGALASFETVLGAEMGFADLYLVSKKGGFDTTDLINNGQVIFPRELQSKVPDALADMQQATRCLAFELPTAAAFHLHRINELVLRRYYDVVTGGKPRPEKRNIGTYIDAMKGYGVGEKVVFSALTNVAKFHRNPVLHPDESLNSVDDALSLLGTINSVVSHMLKTLPPAPLELTAPPSGPSDEIQTLEDKT
jgi:hypothetical protein